jgi:hypothetical protein
MSLEDTLKGADAVDELGQIFYREIFDKHDLKLSTLSRRVLMLISRTANSTPNKRE